MKPLARVLLGVFALLLALPVAAYALDLAAALGTQDDLQRLAIFVAVGLVGMFGHYVKKWLKREINGSLINYLVRDHPRETALAMLVFLGAAGSVYLSGQLAGMPMGPLLMTAFTTGYTCDSALNKGAAQ